MEPLALNAAILGRELPVDLGLEAVAISLLGGDLASCVSATVKSSVKTLLCWL